MQANETPLIWDLEADGLLETITKVWCITIWEEGSYTHYGPSEIETAVKRLNNRWLVCHNQISYDIPAIKKFYPWFKPSKIDDTFILSSLFEPDRAGHGLADWGLQFNVPKPVHEDWTQYSEDMKVRNMTDVQINVMVWDHLQIERNSGWDWEPSIELEYSIATVHAKQEANGVGFNRRAAIDLKETIETELAELTDYILPRIPKLIKPQGEPITKPFKINGQCTKAVDDWNQGQYEIEGPFTRLLYEEPNLNSHNQIKSYLLSQGWVPTEFTDKGSPKLTEDSFESVTGEIPGKVARRNVLLHRSRLIENGDDKGLINLIRKDGRITAGGIPQGTPTGRYRHIGIVNIPSVGSVYGAELRALFIPKAGWLFLGCDAMALERRIEGHYCYPFTGGVEYAKTLLEGDIHQRNADMLKCDRSTAKTFAYAISYGAQPKKIAQSLKCSVIKARRLFNTFWKTNTALSEFKDEVTSAWEKHGGLNGGYLKGLDGRKLYGRSPHSLVNLMFQSAGSIVCKTAAIMLDKWITEEGLKAKQVISMHDELQFEVHPSSVNRLKELSELSFAKAGEQFNLNVVMGGEAKIGKSWRDTH